MALTQPTATRSAIADAYLALADAGAGAAKLELRTSGATLLCTVTLNDPSFTESGGVLTLSITPSDPSGTNVASGDADNAILLDSDDNVVLSGLTVGTSGANVNLSSVTLALGGTVTVTGGTITVPAS